MLPMAWRNYDSKEQKMLFVADWLKNDLTMAELCRCYGVSRKTGYKLIDRYQEEEEGAFSEKSRARHVIANQTCPEVTSRLIELKYKYPTFGPEKLRDWLIRNEPNGSWPAISTIGDILKKHGLVKQRRYRRKAPAYTHPFSECTSANQVWSADYKGQFRLGNGKYCYPLTITDNYSRFLLSCDGMYRPMLKETKNYFEKAFYLYGLPDAIKTDNGKPFAGNGLGGLSQLSIWWLKLGILPERIKPGHPEQNGRHERMHRTLKEATALSPEKNLRKQQEKFNAFIQEYNHERPHAALDKKCPGDVYTSSTRPLPSRVPEMTYPNHFEIRFVRSNGEIKWGNKKYYVSELLYKEPVGIEVIEDGIVAIYYSRLKLAEINEKEGKVIRPQVT